MNIDEEPVHTSITREDAVSTSTENGYEAPDSSVTSSLSVDLDDISELETIQDESTHAGPLEDMPIIHSSTSQLAIPQFVDNDATITVIDSANTTISMDSVDTESLGVFSANRQTETEPTSLDTQETEMPLAMPKIDAQAPTEELETGSIEPLDEDTVKFLSDTVPSPGEPEAGLSNTSSDNDALGTSDISHANEIPFVTTSIVEDIEQPITLR